MSTTTTLRSQGSGSRPRAAHPVRAVVRFATGLAGAIAAGVSRQAINRRVVRQLSVMSERELKDIGLVRQDVADASALGGLCDASMLLVQRRNERKGARRGW